MMEEERLQLDVFDAEIMDHHRYKKPREYKRVNTDCALYRHMLNHFPCGLEYPVAHLANIIWLRCLEATDLQSVCRSNDNYCFLENKWLDLASRRCLGVHVACYILANKLAGHPPSSSLRTRRVLNFLRLDVFSTADKHEHTHPLFDTLPGTPHDAEYYVCSACDWRFYEFDD
jgi:hypothetical protein